MKASSVFTVVMFAVSACTDGGSDASSSSSVGTGGIDGGTVDECLPIGPVVHWGTSELAGTCDKSADRCGTLANDDGDMIECGCGNRMNVCVAGWCECTPATDAAACAACPGKVPRFCGEHSRKTQKFCDPSQVEIAGNLVSCCDS